MPGLDRGMRRKHAARVLQPRRCRRALRRGLDPRAQPASGLAGLGSAAPRAPHSCERMNIEAERPQDGISPMPENDLLLQPVGVVAAIEVVSSSRVRSSAPSAQDRCRATGPESDGHVARYECSATGGSTPAALDLQRRPSHAAGYTNADLPPIRVRNLPPRHRRFPDGNSRRGLAGSRRPTEALARRRTVPCRRRGCRVPPE